MKIWKNTETLDGLIDDLFFTTSKEEANIAILGSKPIQIGEFPNLKGIFRVGVGQDNVPIEEANQRGIMVEFPSRATIEIIYEETACFACFLILRMLYRNIGTLSPWSKLPRISLQNKWLLVIGTGNIGSRVGEKMRPFMNVMSYDKVRNKEAELNDMVASADCISLHIPGTPENEYFMNAKRLALMKDDAVLINTARGKIVSEDALYDELAKGRIFAAFDVYWQEPYRGKLKAFHPDRFYMTPHVASTCSSFLKGCRQDLDNFIKELSHD